jgi:basic membrane lipoprotein Med (substrate-binding protein (PBP1-ABC) superfamily)
LRPSTLVHIALCTTLCACGEAPGQHSHELWTHRQKAPLSSFKVALLTPGPISDEGWNAAAYRGLLTIKDSIGAQISTVQTKSPAEFEENFRQYGAEGFQLVVANGFEYQDVIQRVALDYPRTIFVTTSGDRTGANWAGIDFAFEDGAYIAGVVAGMMTKTNVIATIGGTELPPVRRGFAGFAAGAHSVNPSIKVLSAYVGNWDDAGAAKEQALAQINQGADVIFQNADAAGLGVFQAVKDSKNVWIVGSNSDQNGVAPAVTLGSVVINLPHALLMVAQEVHQGLFIPRVIKLGAQQQVVKFVVNPQLGARLPGPVRVALDSVDHFIDIGRMVVRVSAGRSMAESLAAVHAADSAAEKARDTTALKTAADTGGASSLPPPITDTSHAAPTAAAAGVH